ncbi:rod shape-determining protein MreD [Candidatus Pelagibacter sp.]|nr:rod shape-determining protein MreD [Candidatus Pelagibacter sp.]
MSDFSNKNIIYKLLRLAPVIILYISVLNEFDLNYLKILSLNFPFILIYYWSLRKNDVLGYGYIFFAGLINDSVVGLPIGISSFNYLLICGFAAYLRTITLRPSLVKDWFFFLLTILVVNSLNYSILYLFFSIDLTYQSLFFNTTFTFIFYIFFANIFIIYQRNIFKEGND